MSTVPPPPTRRRKVVVRLLLWTGVVLLLLAAALIGTVAWLLQTPRGLAVMARAATALTPVRILVEGPQGSVRNGFVIARLKVSVDTTEVDVRDLHATLVDFGMQPLRFDFSALSAATVDVRVRPGKGETTGPPDSIASPVIVSAARLQVGEFALRVGADPNPTVIEARAIDAGVALDPNGYRIDRSEFEFGRVDAPLRATATGTLGGARPFDLKVDGKLQSNFQDKPLYATLGATGSLER